MNWRITWRTHSFTQDDLDLNQINAANALLGGRDEWLFDPLIPSHFVAVLGVWLMTAGDRNGIDVMKELGPAKWPELNAAVTVTEV